MEKPKLNIIDRAIGFFNPESAVNRLKHRATLALSGSYSGGSMSRAALRNWNPYAGDANSDTVCDLPTLRTRSRDLARNAPIGGAAINTVVSNVIGTGLSMKLNPDTKYLGMTDEQADEWKREVEAEWLLWCNSLDCDASRSMNFYGIQSLALRSMLESGDVIALTPALKRNNPYSLAIQLVEADRLSNKDNAADAADKVAGVNLDANGAPVSYSISKQHPGAVMRKSMEWTEVTAYGKNGRRNVLHLFDKKRPGQARGVPYLAPVIEILKNITRHSEAELQAAVLASAFAMFIKMDSEAFSSLFDGQSAETYLDNSRSWNGQISMDLNDNSKVVNLLPGEEPVKADFGRPNANFDPFFLAMIKQVGATLDIPFEVLIKHFSSSYSASRAALLDFWRIVRIRRDFMATNFCEPIKDLWFEEAVALGRISAPGFFSDIRIKQAYTRCNWIGDSPGSIDPEKEVNAAKERIDLGISTREKESIAYDGGDWEANHKQLAKEQEMRKADDLIQEAQPRNTSLPPQS